MRRKEIHDRFPLTGLQILGIILLVSGLALLFGCGISAYHYADRDPQEELSKYQEELDADVSMDTIESEIILRNRKKAAIRMPLLVLGGIFVIASPPLFYSPHATGMRIRRRKAEKEEEITFIDEGYDCTDYPDDEFDYILDPYIRERLIREKKEGKYK